MKKLICLLTGLTLTSCASLLPYDYSIGFKNIGTNVVYCYHGHSSHAALPAPGTMVPLAIDTVAGPLKFTPRDIFTLEWQTDQGQSFTNSIDLSKFKVPPHAYIIFTIGVSNQLGAYFTQEPYDAKAKKTSIGIVP